MTERPKLPEDILKLAAAIQKAEDVLSSAITVVTSRFLRGEKLISLADFSLEELLTYIPFSITSTERHTEGHEYAIVYARYDTHVWEVSLNDITAHDPKPLYKVERRTLKEVVIKMACYLQEKGYIE